MLYFKRVKELGPEGGPSKKNNNGGEDDVIGKGNEKYRNAELAMLCTHSVSHCLSCLMTCPFVFFATKSEQFDRLSHVLMLNFDLQLNYLRYNCIIYSNENIIVPRNGKVLRDYYTIILWP